MPPTALLDSPAVWCHLGSISLLGVGVVSSALLVFVANQAAATNTRLGPRTV